MQLLHLHRVQGAREGCQQGPAPHPSAPQECHMDLEVKEQCQDTLWVQVAKKDTWERTGILFNPKGPLQQREEIRSRQERWQVSHPGEHSRRDSPPSEADGMPEERQKGMKTKQTFSADSGQEQGQDNLLPKHHLRRTQMERISLAGRRASQIQYLCTLPCPSLGLSSD